MSDTIEAARTKLAERREAFEAWMKERHQFLGDLLARDAYFRDCYSDRATEEAWQAWQAATKAAEAMERERCAQEAEHWQTISATPGHACGQYIAAAIRGLRPNMM